MDNVVYATDSLRSSVSSLKKKLSNLRVIIEQFDSEISKIDTKFEKLLTQVEIYKNKSNREAQREVRRLQLELSNLKKTLKQISPPEGDKDSTEMEIASTMAIFECILRHMCEGADDVRLMSYAYLFPAVFERVVKGDDPAYLLEKIPTSAGVVINRGKQYVKFIRESCSTHVTDSEAWEEYIEPLVDWWRNDALPLIYGSRDDQWDCDVPLSLVEMLIWRDEPAERPIHFSPVFDAYEIYRSNKDFIYETSGVRALDLKMFTYSSSDQDEEAQG